MALTAQSLAKWAGETPLHRGVQPKGTKMSMHSRSIVFDRAGLEAMAGITQNAKEVQTLVNKLRSQVGNLLPTYRTKDAEGSLQAKGEGVQSTAKRAVRARKAAADRHAAQAHSGTAHAVSVVVAALEEMRQRAYELQLLMAWVIQYKQQSGFTNVYDTEGRATRVTMQYHVAEEQRLLNAVKMLVASVDSLEGIQRNYTFLPFNSESAATTSENRFTELIATARTIGRLVKGMAHEYYTLDEAIAGGALNTHYWEHG